jgi:hypothetical protein
MSRQQQEQQDDSAACHQLMLERQEACVDALYDCAMRGVPEDSLRILASECGVPWQYIMQTHQRRIAGQVPLDLN